MLGRFDPFRDHPDTEGAGHAEDRAHDRLGEGENVLQERQRQTIAAQAPRRFYLSLRSSF
ncbi:hypothetical protein [Plastoroseomonas hellenica]|uniref:hypothetical protein n=1 Tax=Plastoroseomonas hellenica TaxID=2687306 RepID=UPI001BAA6527|nr:hypothetical protein [Plastoroseomonas hellenica]MBR0647484.1 hypothetical protein [Plastoroseomonas hellenica]